MINDHPEELLFRKYSDDDLNVIIQDWNKEDPDQCVSINLAADLLHERGEISRLSNLSRRLLDAAKAYREEAACPDIVQFSHDRKQYDDAEKELDAAILALEGA